LGEHDVSAAYDRGWSTLDNGEPLSVAEGEGFEVLVTTDRDLRHQRDLRERSIAIVVLSTTRWPRIRHDVPAVVRAVGAAAHGSYTVSRFLTSVISKSAKT
jgi:hypothetical protein